MSNPFGRPIYWTSLKYAPLGLVFMWPAVVFGIASLEAVYAGLITFVVAGSIGSAVYNYRRWTRTKRLASCETKRGSVTEILDGSLVAASQVDADPMPVTFVARFEVRTLDGERVIVEPGPARLIDMVEVHVGDEIEIRGPSQTRPGDAYRGTATRVFRGAPDCPLLLSRP